jgi:uncharacterized protein
MNRVVHFEFGASEPARAVKFYQSVFGWEAQQWGGPMEYWLVKTGTSTPGIDGGILRLKDGQPRTVNTIGVDSVDDYCGKVEENGGKVVVPKHAIPGVGYLAYCQDTEGNIFGLHQTDPNAR